MIGPIPGLPLAGGGVGSPDQGPFPRASQEPGAAPCDANHSLAEAAKLVPKGVICLTSALAFHELTDTIPSRVWMAIGPKDRRPRADDPPLQFVRFGQKVLTPGIKEHLIEGVRVRIYSPAKTVVDLFRYRRSAGKRYQARALILRSKA
jgi:predicted transcriptional regulator of viral defense system